MLNKLKVYFAKRDFMARRGEIYELLYANLSESGSGKVATIRELFDAWAVRENKRGNAIALVFRSIVAKLEAGHTFSGAIGPFFHSSGRGLDHGCRRSLGSAGGSFEVGARSVPFRQRNQIHRGCCGGRTGHECAVHQFDRMVLWHLVVARSIEGRRPPILASVGNTACQI